MTDRWMISGTEPISSGSEIWVVVDPENRHRVAIDWDRTRAEYRERTDVRMRVLSTGIPIPVSKVREALEEAGGLRSTAVVEPPDEDEASEAEPEVEVEEPPPAIFASGVASDAALLADPFAGLSLHERDLLSQHAPMPPAQTTVTASVAKRASVSIPSGANDEDGLISKLERLATLNAAGALTGEFSAREAEPGERVI